jgi:hypothetical protein
MHPVTILHRTINFWTYFFLSVTYKNEASCNSCSKYRNISVLVFVFRMVTAFWLYAGLQTRFRTFDTGFIRASSIGYYISSPILEVDKREFHFPS